MRDLKSKITVLVLALSLLFSSCSEWLEMEPINQTYGDGFWTSEAAAEQVLAGAYSHLREAMMTGGEMFMTFGELNSSTMKHKNLTNQEKFSDGSFWNPNMAEFKWEDFFKVVSQCNLIILKTEQLDENLFKSGDAGKKKILGEAYFLRSYAYFYMVKVWGDVPLVINPITSVSQIITDDGYIKNVPRDPEEVVLEQCIVDLKTAESYLEYGSPGSNEWAVRANKGSVQALMAHIYLWMDNPAEAEKAAEKVINDGGYSLVDYKDSLAVVNMFTGRSSEGIFEINISYEQKESYTNGLMHNTLIHPYLWNKNEGGGTWHVKKDYMGALYDSTDLRVDRFFAYWNSARPIILKYASVYYEDEATHYNPHANSNIILFRLSGIILLRAEALANLERFAEARTLLNQIRTRAEASEFTGSDADLQYAIFQEREKELIGEGHTYFDHIRCNEWRDISWMNSNRLELKGYYWPIASDYIINNPKLTQNPYWALKTW